MPFLPPQNARVITTVELDAISPERIDSYTGLSEYHFDEPVIIKGDIAGKAIDVTNGGLWIDGNATNCDLSVGTSETRQAGESNSEIGKYRVDLREAYKKAAGKNVSLQIRGNAVACHDIFGPDVFIGGDVVAGSNRETDRETWDHPNRIVAKGGNLHIVGNVTGQEATQNMANTIKYWHEHGPDFGPEMQGETLAEGIHTKALDRIIAEGNVRIGGDVEGYSISSQQGQITIGGQKRSWVTLESNGAIKLEHTPEMDTGHRR